MGDDPEEGRPVAPLPSGGQPDPAGADARGRHERVHRLERVDVVVDGRRIDEPHAGRVGEDGGGGLQRAPVSAHRLVAEGGIGQKAGQLPEHRLPGSGALTPVLGEPDQVLLARLHPIVRGASQDLDVVSIQRGPQPPGDDGARRVDRRDARLPGEGEPDVLGQREEALPGHRKPGVADQQSRLVGRDPQDFVMMRAHHGMRLVGDVRISFEEKHFARPPLVSGDELRGGHHPVVDQGDGVHVEGVARGEVLALAPEQDRPARGHGLVDEERAALVRRDQRAEERAPGRDAGDERSPGQRAALVVHHRREQVDVAALDDVELLTPVQEEGVVRAHLGARHGDAAGQVLPCHGPYSDLISAE